MDSPRCAKGGSNRGATLNTPEQEHNNRKFEQKRRAEAQAEGEALQWMREPAPPARDPEVARQKLRETDPRYALGETLAREVLKREEKKLFWTSDWSGVPLGLRIATAMPARWRWRVGVALLCWLGGCGAVSLRTI